MVLRMKMRTFRTVVLWVGHIMALALMMPALADDGQPSSDEEFLHVQVRVFDSLMAGRGMELSNRQRFFRLERVWKDMVKETDGSRIRYTYHLFPARVDETKPVLNLYLLEWMSDRSSTVSFRTQVRLDYLDSRRDFGVFSRRKTIPLVGNSIVDEKRMSVVAAEVCVDVAKAVFPSLEALASTGELPEVEGSDGT